MRTAAGNTGHAAVADVFISHVSEDSALALEIAHELERAGYSTWCYELDAVTGPSYLLQTGQAIERCRVCLVVITPNALGSRQMTREIERAHEEGTHLVPVLQGVAHEEFQKRQPEWREAIGTATSVRIGRGGVAAALDRLVAGLAALGVPRSDGRGAERLGVIRAAIDELLDHAAPADAVPNASAESPRAPTTPARTPAGVASSGRRSPGRRLSVTIALMVMIVSVLSIVWSRHPRAIALPTAPPPDVPRTAPSIPAPSIPTPPPRAIPDPLPTGVTRQAVRAALGEPTSSRPASFPHSVVDVFSYGDRVFSYVYDADTERVRQAEVAFAHLPSIAEIEHVMTQMTPARAPSPAVRAASWDIVREKSAARTFRIGDLKATVERRDDGGLHVAVWEATFH